MDVFGMDVYESIHGKDRDSWAESFKNAFSWEREVEDCSEDEGESLLLQDEPLSEEAAPYFPALTSLRNRRAGKAPVYLPTIAQSEEEDFSSVDKAEPLLSQDKFLQQEAPSNLPTRNRSDGKAPLYLPTIVQSGERGECSYHPLDRTLDHPHKATALDSKLGPPPKTTAVDCTHDHIPYSPILHPTAGNPLNSPVLDSTVGNRPNSPVLTEERPVRAEERPVRARLLTKWIIFKWVFIVLNCLAEVGQALLSKNYAEHKISARLFFMSSFVFSSVCLFVSLLDTIFEMMESLVRGTGWCCWNPLVFVHVFFSVIQFGFNLWSFILHEEVVKFEILPLVLSFCFFLAALVDLICSKTTVNLCSKCGAEVAV